MKKIIKPTKVQYISYAAVLLMMAAIIVCAVFFRYLPMWLSLVAIIAAPVFAVGGIIFSLFSFEKTYRLIFMIVAVINVFALAYLILESTGFMEVFIVPDGATDRKTVISKNIFKYLETKGQWATVIFIIMQFLQTVILPIPSALVTAAGSLFYTQAYGAAIGPLAGSLYSLIGIITGSFLAFFLGRKFGIKLVKWIVGRDSLKKVFLMLKGRDIWVLTLMFILPFFPDDILCFVAGMSSMSWTYYSILIVLSRLFVVFSTSFLINLIPFTTWWGILVWSIFIIAIVILFYFSIKKGDKMFNFIKYKIFKKNPNSEKKMDFISIMLKQIEDEENKEKISDQGFAVKRTDDRSGEKS